MATSHNRTVLSGPPATMVLPSGPKATEKSLVGECSNGAPMRSPIGSLVAESQKLADAVLRSCQESLSFGPEGHGKNPAFLPQNGPQRKDPASPGPQVPSDDGAQVAGICRRQLQCPRHPEEGAVGIPLLPKKLALVQREFGR